MRALLLVAVMCFPAVTWACDDGAPQITIVGKLTGERLVVRDERFEGSIITLYLLDLKTGKVTKYASILDTHFEDRTPAQARADAKVRAARWKEAEAKLKTEGLVLQTLSVRPLPSTSGEVKWSQSSTRSDEGGCYAIRLEATRGTERVEVDSTGYCGASDTTEFAGVVETDGYVVPLLSPGCLDSPDRWMHAFKIAELFKPKAK